MSRLEFTPADFAEIKADTDVSAFACELANRKLAQMLAEAQMLYGTAVKRSPIGTLYYPEMWDTHQRPGFDTHRARLVCIEELPK